MDKELTREEWRQVQLKMLDELHAFCTARELRYSLAFGTLIGAIRHKGFIPWDDDVDIIMPVPDMLRLKAELKSDNIKYLDIDTEPHFSFGFSRIAHRATFQKTGRSPKMYGVTIDLYPLIPLPKTENERQTYFAKGELLLKKRMRYVHLRDALSNRIGIGTILGFDRAVRAYRDHMLFTGCPYEETSVYFILSMGLRRRAKVMYDYDLFQSTQLTEFEGRQYSIISSYDAFLRQFYGDYMQLPPEKDRHPRHGGHFYWY